MLKIDSSIIWVIVNLLIFYFLIRKFLFKRVLDMIEQRKKLVEGQFADAAAAQKEADEKKAQYEESLKNAKEESMAIVEEAKRRGDAEYAQILNEAKQQSQELIEKTNRSIEKQQEKAMQEIQNQIGDLAMAAAAKIIGDQSNPDTDEAIYNEFLNKTGDK